MKKHTHEISSNDLDARSYQEGWDAARVGISNNANPYIFSHAQIKEQASWFHGWSEYMDIFENKENP